MFKKLRNRFILTNLITTSIVLVVAFSVIYIIVATTVNRLPVPTIQRSYSPDVTVIISENAHLQRTTALQTLLGALIAVGLAVECIVALISFYLAEQAIKPIKESYELQQIFIANASHEIKTPLAVIQANLEAADIKNNPWIDNASNKLSDLINLNSQLLTLTQLESTTSVTPTKINHIELSEFVQKTSDFFLPQIQDKSAKLTLVNHLQKPQFLELDSSKLEQLLNILLDNAIKYCHHVIKIELFECRISISNDGTAIHPDQLNRIFDRFYQADKTKPGVGLGLSIAKSIADQQHWKLTATSDHKRTTFTIDLS